MLLTTPANGPAVNSAGGVWVPVAGLNVESTNVAKNAPAIS